MNLSVSQAAHFLRTRDNILILTHIRPDGDTIGCAAGLCIALREQGKQAHVLENPEATSLFLPYLEGLVAPSSFLPDTVVSVDIAAVGLFPKNAQPYLEKGIDLAIDHHPSQEFFAQRTCLDASRAACGELVYDLVRELGPLSPAAALPLYVAVSTDCGCFVYGNTTPATHRVAAHLMETGIPTADLNHRHFRTKSLKRLQLEGMLIQSAEFYDNGTIGVVCLSLDMMAQINAVERDAEDIAAFVGQIEGVKTGATIRELRPGICKISLRTDPNQLNATQVCALLGGGGHAAASGATVEGDIQTTKTKLLEAIRQIQQLG